MPSARVICPYCNAKLRLSTAGGAPTRAKCRSCGRTFTPTYTQEVKGEALYLDLATSSRPLSPLPPLPVPGEEVRPPVADARDLVSPLPPHTLPPREPEAVPPIATPPSPAVIVPPSPAPLSAKASPPAAPPRSAERDSATEGAEPEESRFATSTSTATAAALTAPSMTAARARKLVEKRRRDSCTDSGKDQLRPFEIVLALFLVLGGLTGLGLLGYRYYGQPKDSAAAGSEAAEQPPAPDPLPMRTTEDLTPKSWPKQLFGSWELRSDDGRAGHLILGPEGVLVAASNTYDTGTKDPEFEGRWFPIKENGNRFVLEFGSDWRSLDSYQVTVNLTCPDAFTLVETTKGGVTTHDQHRFVRTGDAPKRAVAPEAPAPALPPVEDLGVRPPGGQP